MLKRSALLHLTHAMLRYHCREGDRVLDATAGNGHDTTALAVLVGKQGRVLAVDKQEQALEATQARLDSMALLEQVSLVQADHAHLEEVLQQFFTAPTPEPGLAAAVFNLGYLPGSDKTVTTQAASTLAALDAVWYHLRPGGLLSVHSYSGHAGGQEEYEAVAKWMRHIPWQEAQVTDCTQYNKAGNTEALFFAIRTPF